MCRACGPASKNSVTVVAARNTEPALMNAALVLCQFSGRVIHPHRTRSRKSGTKIGIASFGCSQVRTDRFPQDDHTHYSALAPRDHACDRFAQERHIKGDQHQADRNHLEAEDRQEPETPADDEQYTSSKTQPAKAGLA